MNDGRRIISNFTALFAAQAVSAAAGLISTAYLARTLGAEAYGILGFGTAVMSYFGLLVVLGTDTFGMREIARKKESIGDLVRSILGLRAALSVVIFALYLLVVSTIDEPERVKTVMMIQGLGLFTTALGLDFVYQGLQRMGIIAVRQAAAAILVLIAVVLLVHAQEHILIAAAVPASAIIATNLWLAWRMNRDVTRFGVIVDAPAWAQLIKGSWPIALAAFMTAIYFNMDIVMLGFLTEKTEVGHYVGASRIYTMSLVLGGLVASTYTPVLARAWGDGAQMRKSYRDCLAAVMFFGAPLAALGVAFPSEILGIVFGAPFLAGRSALVLLMINVAVTHWCLAATMTLIAWNEQMAQMVAHAAGGVVNILLNLVLIPRYGIEGAALATLISQSLVLAGIVVRLYLRYRLFELRLVAVLIVSAAFAFAAAKALAILGGAYFPGPAIVVFAVSAVLGGVLFIGLAVMFKAIDPSRLKSALSRRGRPAG